MVRLAELKVRMAAIELLSLWKREATYAELAQQLGLPIPVISRYVKGHTLPSIARAQQILRAFSKGYLEGLVKSKIRRREFGIYDMTAVVYDVGLLRMIAKVVANEFPYAKVDAILTAETDGVPLAVQVANEFGVRVVIAKGDKEPGVDLFLEARRIPSPGTVQYLYLQRGAIGRGDNIMIVDDLIRSGSTLMTLASLVEKGRARVVCAYVIATIEGSEPLPSFPFEVKSLVRLEG